ncbi:tbc1 domain family member 4-like [Limosa lapponica baueri]|uniref:Tbc1 domain family member 4-like n=1 Tax=Limosa lapponica baueri TaxID=1758121 RepID=A0A2I0TT28_LIMLA|nr:tbc1 domain family member 4-like [Limosa lapponica baueri]
MRDCKLQQGFVLSCTAVNLEYLYNSLGATQTDWYEALDVEGQSMDDVDDDPFTSEVFPRPPDKGDPIEAFLLQLQDALCSQALILLGDFSHPDICWESSIVSCKQSRRVLECIEDNFLSQVVDSPTRRDAILDLWVTNASELIDDIKIGGRLGCSDQALVEFAVPRDVS